MPQGYLDAMRIFNKILKPPFSNLRTRGFISLVYVDDTLLIGYTYDQCLENVLRTVEMLRSLGFHINVKKSVFTPTQEITFLGFIISSTAMTISLTHDKKELILKFALSLLESHFIPIRILASFIGKIISAFPAVTYGRAFYRDMEYQKIDALKAHKGNFDGLMSLNTNAISEIEWWRDNIMSSFANISPIQIDMAIKCDASKLGWGVHHDSSSFGGRWSLPDQENHINLLELLAIQYAVFFFI